MNYRASAAPCVIYAVSNRLIGLDPSAGEPRWEVMLESTAKDISFLATNTAVFACGNGPNAYCIDPTTGRVRWQTNTNARGLPDIAISGSLLVLGRRGCVVALDAATGGMKWRHDEEHYPERCPINVGGAAQALQLRSEAIEGPLHD